MSAKRDAQSIIDDILSVTADMLNKPDNPDYLLKRLDRRGLLMAELQDFHSRFPEKVEKEQLASLARELSAMDKKLYPILERHKRDVKDKIIGIRKQQREAEAKAFKPAPAGSFMKLKK